MDQKRLGLFTDKTIKKYVLQHKKKKRSFEEEIDYRLDYIDKDFKKKRIKLLYIKDRLKHIK